MGDLRVVFDPAFDGHAWPGPLGGRTVVLGEEWVGPQRLLSRLETELGITVPARFATDRAPFLCRRLAQLEGFWSQSFASDPLGTTKRLLADRDVLAMWGWNGEPAGTRLDALWIATREALPGLPDRLHRVLQVLQRRRVALASITVFDTIEGLPTLWRRVFVHLEQLGVPIVQRSLPVTTSRGDLQAARGSAFNPVGDGSLQLLRTHGVLAAAEEVAAWLAGYPRLDDVVLIGADAILNAELLRHGLPGVGCDRGPSSSSSLLRLALECAFLPTDPAHLHALLCADPGPIPRAIARRLVFALNTFPGRGSDAWKNALREGLESIEPERRPRVAERVSALLVPVAPRDGAISATQIEARLRSLCTWARGRAETESTMTGVVAMCERLLSLVAVSGAEQFTRIQVERLCDEVGVATCGGGPAEAGLPNVSGPGAIIDAAPVIVWWNFTRTSAPTPGRLRLSTQERGQLEKHGITSPDFGGLMAGEARRWRRPLHLATDTLLLVCARTDEESEPAHPHPLWDELVATMPSVRDSARLVSSTIQGAATTARTVVALRALPTASDTVTVATPIALPGPASPSSIEQLIACSFAWFLERPGRLRRGITAAPEAPGPLLFGNLAHHVLARVFERAPVDEKEVGARSETIFEEEVERLAESLLIPDHQAERAEIKAAILDSSREIARIVNATGATIRGVELQLEGSLGSVAVRGRADTMLSRPDHVIDYKWGASKYRDRLQTGTALQLVAYAELGRTTADLPGVAYLSLRTQALLAAPGSVLPNARIPGVHTVRQMLDAAVAALDARISELNAGKLFAPSANVDFDREQITAGRMQLAPPCGFCDYATLCGKRLRV